jgi:tetratricopeptide (TPR) repeat protein
VIKINTQQELYRHQQIPIFGAMSNPLCFLLFIFSLMKVPAQDLDSLKRLAAGLAHDTNRVNLFYNEGFRHRASDPQYSYDCARLAENYAQRANQPYYTAKAFNLLGILYYRKGDLGRAVSFHKEALALRRLIRDSAGIALSLVNLGNAYSEMELYPQAETAYLEALALNTDLGQQKQAGNCLLNLGVMVAGLKKAEAAENYFNLALANARMRYDYELQASCLNNLAEVHLMHGNYDAAMANASNSLKIKELMDNDMDMADSYLILSKASLRRQQVNEGKNYLRMADSIIDRFGYLAARLQSLMLHADYWVQEKNYELAYQTLNRYHQLKDSLELANEDVADASFTETPLKAGAMNSAGHSFPYFYFWLLFAATSGGAIFVYRFRR